MADAVVCPFCKGEIDVDALKCRHCGEWVRDKPAPSVSETADHAPCTSCGTQAQRGDRWCTQCGKPLSEEARRKTDRVSSSTYGGFAAASLMCLLLLFVVFVLHPDANISPSRSTQASTRAATQAPSSDPTIGWYHVTGSAPSVSVTYKTPDGVQQEASETLPWDALLWGTRGDIVYVSAQNQGPYGSVTASIEWNQATVATSTSNGGFVIATASGRLR